MRDACDWLVGVAVAGTAVTSLTTSSMTSEDDDSRLSVMIGVSVAAAVLLVVLVGLFVVYLCLVYRRRSAAAAYRTNSAAWPTDDRVTCVDVVHTRPPATGQRSRFTTASLPCAALRRAALRCVVKE